MKTYCKPAKVNVENTEFNIPAVRKAFDGKYKRRDFQRLLLNTSLVTEQELAQEFLDGTKQKILIVDDSEMNRAILYEMLHDDFEILEAESGELCIDMMKQYGRDISLLLLDIVMPGMDGFSMAGKMQKSYPNIVLIFVSSHESLVFQSYEYDTFWFMRKSALITDLKKAIDKYFARIVYNELYYVVNAQKVYYKDILYIECNGHLITIKTADRTYSMCGSLKKLEEELTPYQFIRVHKSFLVNMKQINVIHNDKIILTDNSSVLLSKSRRAEVRKLYFRGGA